MATKRIQIEFDLNTNEVKLAGEATLSLAQQVRILQKELSKTPEGTKEFELLRNKLNDTRDNFERVNAKSRELFGTLSLIPGPIGEIAGKVNGAISLLKVFSGFSLKDIQGQFKSLVEDVKTIGKNILGLNDSAKELNQTNQSLTNSTNGFGDSIQNANVASGQLVQTQVNQIETNEKLTKSLADYEKALADEKKFIGDTGRSVQELSEEQKQNIPITVRNAKTHGILTGELSAQEQAIQESRAATLQQSKALTENTVTEKTNTTSKEVNTLATRLNMKAIQLNLSATEAAAAGNVFYATTFRVVATAANIASTALRVFKAVLISLGIGALIVVLTEALTALYNFATGTGEAEAATKAFNDELERQNELLDLEKAALKRAGDERIAQLKSQGASEKSIRNEILSQRQKDYELALKGQNEAADLYNRSLGKADEATLKTLGDNLTKRQQQTKDALSQLRVTRLENIAQEKKDNEDAEKEREEKEKEKKQKRINELNALIQLEIDSKTTEKETLKKLLEERLQLELELEKKSGAEILLLRQENSKKIEEAIQEDFETRRNAKIADYDALIQIEENQADVDTERLIKLLEKRRDLELQEANLTKEQKLAIQAKYEADFRKLRQDAREAQLVEDINFNRNNLEKQIELYRQFGDEVINSTNYTEAEKLRIIQETNDKIQSLETLRFENARTELQLSLGLDYQYNKQYFDDLSLLYDAEEERYGEYLDQQIISTEEYNKKMLELSDAREKLRQDELDSQLATLEAVSSALQAGAALVGESTRLGKSLAVAGATIDTYRAANQVLADPKIPTAIKAFSAAAIILRGLANVRRIIATPIPNTTTQNQAQVGGGTINVNARRAQGGMIFGPGGDTSDSIPAMLSNGEFVVNARSTRVFRPLLESMNSAANLPQFAVGGLVTGGGMNPPKSQNETLADAISNAFGSTPIRTYVTANEVSTQQQFDRIIKSRSLI